MDVRCPQCQTLYELDDEQLQAGAVTLKCSQCQHVFRLEGHAEVIQENQRRWMVRNVSTGDILYLTGFDVLHGWIMQRQVGKDDEISRTGRKWVTLGSIGEFTPVFQVVESISNIAGEASRAPSPDDSTIAQRLPTHPPGAPDESGERERVKTSLQFGSLRTEPPPAKQRTQDITRKVGPSQPANELPPRPRENPPVQIDSDLFRPESEPNWSLGDVELAPESETSGSYLQTRPRRGRAPLIVGFLLLALGGSGVYLWMFQPRMLDGIVESTSPEPDVVPIGQPEAVERPEQSAPEALVEPGAQAMHAAVASAEAALATRHAEIFHELHAQASEPLYEAQEKAARHVEGDGALTARLAKAQRARDRGNLTRARDIYHQILDRQENVDAMIGLGWTLLEMGQADSAIAQFNRAIYHDRNAGDAYIGLGSAQRAAGNYQAAYEAYDRYLGRFPNGPKASIASYQMAQLKKQLGL